MHLFLRTIFLSILSLLSGVIFAYAGQESFPVLTGHLLYTDYIEGNDQGCIATLAPESDDSLNIIAPPDAALYSNSSFFIADQLVCPFIRYDENNQRYIKYDFFDAQSGEITRTIQLANSNYFLPSAAVYIPDEENLFMLCYIDDLEHYSWVTISTQGFLINSRVECPEGEECFALSLAPDGTIYGFSRDNYLCRINRNDGSTERLFKTIEKGSQDQAAYYDATRHAIYRSIPTNTGCAIYRYDLITEKESAIRSYQTVTAIRALALDSLHNELRVPAAVTNLNITFTDQNLVNKGTIHFTAPTTDLQSHSLTSRLQAIIAIDQIEVDTIDLQAGQPYNISLVFPDGSHIVSLQTYNQYGKGELSYTRIFAGYDYPLPVEGITVETALPTVNLSWDKPGSVHDGILNPEALRYRVTRYPEGITIADTPECMASDTLPQIPGTYYYGITAYIHSYETEESFSAPTYYNCIIEPPYYVTKWSNEVLSAYTIDDANHDGSTWYLFTASPNNPNVCYHYHTANQADDKLYTPAIRLKQDTLYQARLYLRAGAEEFVEHFSASVTYAPCGKPATQQGLFNQPVQSTESRCYQFSFSVPCDSLYNLCIHCNSEPNRYMLHVDSLSLTPIGTASVPDSVATFSLSQGYYDRNTVSICCKAPVLTAGGDTLTSLSGLEIYRNDTLVHTIKYPQPGTTYWCTDSVTHIDNYRYTAIAINEAGRGIPAYRNIVLGVYNIPYRHDFAQGLGYCTVVDNNHDGNTWHLYADRFMGCMRYLSSETETADDWIVTPPLLLTDTMRYEVHCRCCAGLSQYPESLRIALGRTPQPNDMSFTIKTLDQFTFINDTTIIIPFDIATTAHYYIGIQAHSKADSYAILLRGIAVQEYDPAAVTAPRTEAPAKIWGGSGYMTAYTDRVVHANIYDLTGMCIKEMMLSPGTNEWEMPTGIYIVQVDDAFTFKIVVF